MIYKRTYFATLAIVFTISVLFVCESYSQNVPKNIILMISDGCGHNQINATSIYQYGDVSTQVYEKFPIQLWVSTYSARDRKVSEPYKEGYEPEKAWSWFEYVKSGATDSAASATAMATGFKSYNSAIGVDVNKNIIKNISELAKEKGKSAGVVTSVQISHATPAGFVAHNGSRSNYSQIAIEMLLDSKMDVIMGCGNPLYDDNGKLVSKNPNYSYVGGESVWNGLITGKTDFDIDNNGIYDNFVEDCDGDLIRDPWTLIQDLKEFRSLMEGETPKRVLGIPKVLSTLQCNRTPVTDRNFDGKKDSKDAVLASDIYLDPFNSDVPSLQEMVSGAINVLDNNKKGFFLMVEGGAIDWASHSNALARMIEEQIEFNKAIEAAVKWIETKSSWDETLLIITGDHETGYLTGPDSGPDKDDPNDSIKPVWNLLVNNGKGKLPKCEWHSTGHTNSLIPIYAKGAGCDLFKKYADEFDPVRGAYIDNTEIAKVMFELFK